MLHVEKQDGVAVLRVDRPPANAIDLELARELAVALSEIEKDESVRALVLTGTGAFFSAGLDLKVVPTYDAARQRAMVTAVNKMILSVYALPLPVIAAVNGHAVAGGLVVALACDYRVGPSNQARIGLTESRVAIPYPVAAITVTRCELNPSAARVLVLSGKMTHPEDARSLGVLDELQPPNAVVSRAIAVAADMGATPRHAYGRIKRQLREAALARIEDVVAKENDPLADSWLGAETASAAAAQLGGKRG